MSLKGNPWSNAVQENFFQKLKHEFIRGRMFKDIEKQDLRCSGISRYFIISIDVIST